MQPKSKVEHLGRRIRETLSENCESEKDLERFSYIITTKRALATMQPSVGKRKPKNQEEGTEPHFYCPHWKDCDQFLDLPSWKNVE